MIDKFWLKQLSIGCVPYLGGKDEEENNKHREADRKIRISILDQLIWGAGVTSKQRSQIAVWQITGIQGQVCGRIVPLMPDMSTGNGQNH